MEELKIKAANAQEAYRNADAKGKKILEDLFGKDALVPKDITDRIKTLEDALAALGTPEGEIKDFFKKFENLGKDVVAYMKLKVIIEALNDGWKPTFKDGEWRYYPWFVLYTKEEWDELSDEDKKDGVCFSGNAYHGAMGGFVCADSSYAPSYAAAHIGSRLCLKTDTLARYCGKQFIEIWKDFLF